jgi:hypothetical protein
MIHPTLPSEDLGGAGERAWRSTGRPSGDPLPQPFRPCPHAPFFPRKLPGRNCGQKPTSVCVPHSTIFERINPAQSANIAQYYEDLMLKPVEMRPEQLKQRLDSVIHSALSSANRTSGRRRRANNGRAPNESELWDCGDRSEGRP